MCTVYVHVKLSNGQNDGNTVNAKSFLKILKKLTQDPAGIRTQDLLITSQTLLATTELDLLWQRSVGWMLMIEFKTQTLTWQGIYNMQST